MNIQIPNFDKVHVLVVGDVMLDRYWIGNTSRISPEAPIPVVHVRERDSRPGGAANVALNLRTLGCEVTLMGTIGNDNNGEQLEDLLTQSGIHCVFQRLDTAPTITKLRIVSHGQQLLRVDFEEEPASFSPTKQLEEFRTLLNKIDAIILSDYAKGVLKNADLLIDSARKMGIPVIVDPKRPSFSYYAGATLITPNMKEFQEAAGQVKDLNDLEAKAREQMDQHNIEAFLVTRSEHGMSLIQRGQEAIHIPTKAKEVFDVTGAGDTVIATLAGAIGAGQSWGRAMSLANLAAGISVSKMGTATVSVPELRRALHEEHQAGEGVVTEEHLVILVQDAKAHGEKVVMTNGCFDIIHAGHIAYLEEAKKLGDKLIVAINDDESVKRLKGPSRPICSLEQRMAVLAGLKSVDWVIPFSEDTPERVISAMLPDVLVKGGDYKVEQIAGAHAVINNGGRVEILCFKEGLSTSNIIRKAKGEKA